MYFVAVLCSGRADLIALGIVYLLKQSGNTLPKLERIMSSRVAGTQVTTDGFGETATELCTRLAKSLVLIGECTI